MSEMDAKMAGFTRILSAVAVLAVVVALVLVFLPGHREKHLTAYFPRTVSLYEGSDVRILGVPVGTVDSVTPSGTDVRVRMSYDAKYKVPADAKAVIISPAIVGDRYVQLTPVYHSGPVMADGKVLRPKRTATPLELDEIYKSVDQLMVALGPNGANKHGALTHLLNSTAKNFAGQGAQFHTTIKNLARLTSTLDDNKDQLFGTARQIERFVNALAKNDKTVRHFNDSLTASADLLKDERHDLAAALHNLGIAMQQVRSFVKQNKHVLSKNIKGLDQISKILVKQRAALDEVLTDAPDALTNLFHTYNPAAGTLDTRTNLGENISALTANPASLLCALVHQAKAPKKACSLIKKALPRPAPHAGTGPAESSRKVVQVEHIDRSLAGIVEVRK
ncbi:MAG TPA: MCE family protein [Nocardioidaceae bacterium]|nr:MCE family protein [Nocardioidaceae bacterium]